MSDANDKTVVVRVERRFTDPLLKKTVRKTKKYHAHDADNAAKVGRHGAHSGMCADFEEEAVDADRGAGLLGLRWIHPANGN